MKQCNLQVFESLLPLPESLTVCATIDESGREQEITEFMVRRACEQLDVEQHWPYGTTTAICKARPARGADILQFRRRS